MKNKNKTMRFYKKYKTKETTQVSVGKSRTPSQKKGNDGYGIALTGTSVTHYMFYRIIPADVKLSEDELRTKKYYSREAKV
jgi:hypothetical protein